MEDSALIEAYCKGSAKAFDDLFYGHKQFVAGICLKYLQDRENSRDACMEIFSSLWQNICSYKIENFRPWLYVFTRNHCLMQLRKSNPQKISISDMEFSLATHPFEEDKMELLLQKLESLLPKLSIEQQTCIRLFFIEGKSYAGISASTGWEFGKVKSYIQNGKRNLLQWMSPNV